PNTSSGEPPGNWLKPRVSVWRHWEPGDWHPHIYFTNPGNLTLVPRPHRHILSSSGLSSNEALVGHSLRHRSIRQVVNLVLNFFNERAAHILSFRPTCSPVCDLRTTSKFRQPIPSYFRVSREPLLRR